MSNATSHPFHDGLRSAIRQGRSAGEELRSTNRTDSAGETAPEPSAAQQTEPAPESSVDALHAAIQASRGETFTKAAHSGRTGNAEHFDRWWRQQRQRSIRGLTPAEQERQQQQRDERRRQDEREQRDHEQHRENYRGSLED